jgi:D-alanyl-D-alanine carboxypeptidase/D-alanyl-D-alanine-endopeptidase (penicillin-binding protein 4)
MTSRPRTVTPRRLVVALVATALGVAPALATTGAAHAAGPGDPTVTVTKSYRGTAADTRIASQLTARATTARFGTSVTGAVVDAASGKVVWRKNGTTALMPASTAKWATATDALRVFGSSYRFTTTVKRGAQLDQVILVGSGDPSFSSTQLTALAKTTAAAMKAKGQLHIRLYADDSLFAAPTLATGWRSTYIPADTTWLRALVVDGRQVTDTSLDAANLFAAKLKTYGLTVASVSRATAIAGNPVLASSAGVTVGQMVSWMMLESDNEHAEALHRLVGVRKGYGNTWAAATSAQTAQLTSERLTATALYDGSGLSRSDRLSGLQLAALVTNIFEPGNATAFALLRSDSGLPISGRTGTLRASYDRFTAATSRCAVGAVHAKTGTLTDAVSLAGWTRGTDGGVKTFAFVINGKPTSTTLMRQNIDMLAATVNGCY